MIYEIVDAQKQLIKYRKNEKFVKINNSTLYIKKVNDKFSVVINSFQNKLFLLENKKIKNKFIEVPESLKSIFEFPKISEVQLKDDERYQKYEDYINISIAMSYSCNLRCSYCFQQKNKNLNRRVISEDYLEKIFAKIIELQDRYHKTVDINLFGGEPFLPKNEEIINKIFDFALKRGCYISAVSNGIFLPYYAKKLIIYKNIISSIATTINSTPDDYKNSKKITKVANNPEKLALIVGLLLKHGVQISVGTNVDKLNINELPNLLKFFEEQGFLKNEKFNWRIGRVDDRFYDSNYPYILTESDILAKLQTLSPLPGNVTAAFMQTSANLAQKLGFLFGQQQLKGEFSYCWALSPYNQIYYVDNDLKLFRCTVTVGREELAIGNLENTAIQENNVQLESYLDFDKCKSCKIGGFCSGGCKVSRNIDFNRQCNYERKAFDKFIDNILLPKVKELTNEI
ncbi:radical SAM/SPASM domain-containing protein [Lactococcus lactis]|jgi:uncharacterized protein|uniref:radical SAM/SPASM domain-containing protein n=1 Tax=Lactococcus TaxID=1357 RepID=UPI00288C81DD|nr:radical SAM protein [Lactococcus lactis]MDT2871591.1 radical SAM protein [Lactococcus lactis]MDT2890658.1 radical SAM protein [Lactococcus lactis]MDT2893193.1 radical SAM protein [Lactococcus lactis]MDT2895767.1 radical SAM protein [Lactococcus lactis]MDT2914698.1 radical SAM protein [Lactococcus lactis]